MQEVLKLVKHSVLWPLQNTVQDVWCHCLENNVPKIKSHTKKSLLRLVEKLAACCGNQKLINKLKISSLAPNLS